VESWRRCGSFAADFAEERRFNGAPGLKPLFYLLLTPA
jgi:hypothetical protein